MQTHFSTSAGARDALLAEALAIAGDAGRAIMDVYGADWSRQPDVLGAQIKADQSPVTAADHAAHRLIVARLKALTPGIAIISEENHQHPDIPENGLFWCVDPLDGTKEFLARTGAFTINIALLDRFVPVLGVMHNPAMDATYYSAWNTPAFKKTSGKKTSGEPETRIIRPCTELKPPGALTTLFNSKHGNMDAYNEARARLQARGIEIPAVPEGRSGLPRNMQVAEGMADIFVDCGKKTSLVGGNGYSWDYAPNWLILRNAGGIMLELASGREPAFTRPTERMNAYAALGNRVLGAKAFPEWKNIALGG